MRFSTDTEVPNLHMYGFHDLSEISDFIPVVRLRFHTIFAVLNNCNLTNYYDDVNNNKPTKILNVLIQFYIFLHCDPLQSRVYFSLERLTGPYFFAYFFFFFRANSIPRKDLKEIVLVGQLDYIQDEWPSVCMLPNIFIYEVNIRVLQINLSSLYEIFFRVIG